MQKFFSDAYVILFFYVDDMLVVDKNATKTDKLKKQPSKSVGMKDFVLKKQILGIRIIWDRSPKQVYMYIEKFILKVL